MGLFSEWFGVRVQTDATLREAKAFTEPLERFSPPIERHGWLWAPSLDAYGASWNLVQEIAAALSEPALGGWVANSMFACMYGSQPGGEVLFEFAINDHPDPEDELEERLYQVWMFPERRRAEASGLAAWSSEYAPRAVTAELILKGMPGQGSTEAPTDDIYFGRMPDDWRVDNDAEGDDDYRGGGAWLWAEDGIRFLFDRLGFGSTCDDIWGAAYTDRRRYGIPPDDSRSA
jgi:hypothetical protein